MSNAMPINLLLIALTGYLAAAEPAWTGYRGPEGSGVFPDSKPPVDCDMASGRNIRWRTPLPNWCNGSPLVIKDRAYVMSEPGWKHDWPVLSCLAIADGKVLWEREINHLPATGLSSERQVEVAKQWHDFQAEWRALYTIFAETVAQGDQEAAKKRFKERGYEFSGHRGGGYGQLRSLSPKGPKLKLGEAGLRPDVWRHDCGLGYDEIAPQFATPVSDGEHVYVVASRSAAASFDRDGKQRWITFVPPPKELSGYNESLGRSPILYRDLMISDYFGYTCAFDKATGAIRWQVKTYGGGIATPIIITVAGTDILLTEGYQGAKGGLYAIRLPEGKALDLVGEKEGTGGWGPSANVMLVNSDHRDLAFFTNAVHTLFQGKNLSASNRIPAWTNTVAGVRFSLNGETLKASVLWEGENGGKGSGPIPIVYHRDRLYLGGSVLDPLSGKTLVDGGRGKPQSSPSSRHLLLIAGDRIYGLNGHARLCDQAPEVGKPMGTLECFDLAGKKLGSSALLMAKVEGDKLAQIRSQVGWDRWGFSYSSPFTIAGDRLYLRSADELICVGEK